MTTIKEKRKYEKPAMQVYLLPESMRLLAGSGGGGLDDYTPNTPQNWP